MPLTCVLYFCLAQAEKSSSIYGRLFLAANRIIDFSEDTIQTVTSATRPANCHKPQNPFMYHVWMIQQHAQAIDMVLDIRATFQSFKYFPGNFHA
jgi:3-hydroxymyristoyl/3-hydroxydecanoyl-(acyl carrier protein) dehydratase